MSHKAPSAATTSLRGSVLQAWLISASTAAMDVAATPGRLFVDRCERSIWVLVGALCFF